MLLIIVACMMRVPPPYVELHRVLRCYAAAVLCELAWRRSCRHAPHGGSYARWRHLALPAFMLGDLLLARNHIVRARLEATLGPSRGAAHHFLMLILASRMLTNWMVWFLCHRLVYALPAQLIIIAHHIQANSESCGIMLSAAPSAAAWVHNVSTVVELSQLGAIGAVAHSRPLTPAEQCRTVLAWQQLCFSLAAPALVAAVVEIRLWRRHQAEQRQSGLPAEGGWQPSFYRVLQELLLGHDWPHIVVLSWLLSGVLYLAAVALSVDA
ncbi:hypothetical protein COHA_006545 [Chlorella ohadii]|uniref:Uncharacterized protein n=1 Tax=Chlorella ohadii TaxID=2649997 RepID=A0AAD5DML7_9CHLO|nr:hypothetical protein COHA_006545 [Chlorella ohadii]